MQINIFKGDRASNGAVALKNSLGATMLRATGSKYSGRKESCVINWGNTSAEADRLAVVCANAGRDFLNLPIRVASVVNKRDFFEKMQAALPEVTIPWCLTFAEAAALVRAGSRVFARTSLSSHSGKGIVLMVSAADANIQAINQLKNSGTFPVFVVDGPELPSDELARCRLFTQGISGSRIEYRIHVVRGEAILAQSKRRKAEFQANSNYQSIVRNVGSGWIYAVNALQDEGGSLAAAKEAAINTVTAMGLDFGAVDIVWQRGNSKAYVLEVNTAPGLEEDGSALTAYTEAFKAI